MESWKYEYQVHVQEDSSGIGVAEVAVVRLIYIYEKETYCLCFNLGCFDQVSQQKDSRASSGLLKKPISAILAAAGSFSAGLDLIGRGAFCKY